MARYTTTPATITANGTYKICDIHRARDREEYVITVMMTGGFGGGTPVVQISPDGVNFATLASGNVVPTWATGQAYTFRTGSGHALNDSPSLYVTVTGATAATLVVTAWDNN